MNSKDLQNALTNVDDKYIAESATYKRSTRSLKVWRAIAIAACCLIALPLTVVAAFVISDSASSGKSASSGDYYYSETRAETAAAGAYDSYDTGGGYTNSYSGSIAYEAAEAEEAAPALGSTTENGKSTSESSPAKIIRTANIDIPTTDYESSVAVIESLTGEFGAYFESKNMSDGSGYRYASFSVRVPAENYDRLVEALKEAGTITDMNENAQDVSDSYYDIESRLKTARTKLERLRELLAQAEDMTDIITIEEAISDVEWEIDDLQGILNNYDSKVSYSTVYIYLNEVYKVEHTETPMTFSEKIAAAFKNGLQSFGYAMEDIAVWFAESWIWLLIVGLIIAGAIIVPIACVRGARRRRNR